MNSNNSTSDYQFKMKRKRKDSKSTVYNSNSINSDKSIFNNFKESSEEFANLLNISEDNKGKDVMQRKKRQNIRKSQQNSVIIINDSENESNDKDKPDNSVSIIECSPDTCKTSLSQSPLLRQRRKQLKNTLKPRTRSSVILLDDDSSASAHVQNSSCEKRDIYKENTEDDIVELWSCMRRSNQNKKASKKCNDSLERENTFIIDTRPNLENLDYIKIDKSPVRKRQKQQWHDKDLSMIKFNTCVTRNLLDKRQRTKAYKRLNTYISEHQDKKNEKENSDGKHELREIIIDGCNVAMAHTNGRGFSEKGIKLMIDYFESRGHVVKVFLPQHVRRKEYQLLEEMYTKGIIVFTPSRKIAGKQITPYDDRYILEYATKCGGIVISSDQYRDLYKENPEWRDTILNRLLTPTFVGDYIMFPVDPLGKSGPDLETFLRH